ncbi:MAG: hypothetical protein EA425_03855 [Puniceicoccaceae bacterium]|nr:MAG: hypothetical protein EA425_03855 [Puniceicoccaceae bacterium]
MPLDLHDLLRIWEAAASQQPLDRWLTVLAVAHPDRSREELARLPLGERDRLLYRLRVALFGESMEAYAACPACGEKLETDCTTVARQAMTPPRDATQPVVTHEGRRFTICPIDSWALIQAAGLPDAAERRSFLAAYALGGQAAEYGKDCPPDLITALEAAADEADPAAEVRLDLVCPACGHGWQEIFEIGRFLWEDICRAAGGLLDEVHCLASAYGWRENDILALSPARRGHYLDRVLT